MSSDDPPNERERPPTHLCREHSGRVTQPSDCPACARKREMVVLKRGVELLERRVASLEARLDATEGDVAVGDGA